MADEQIQCLYPRPHVVELRLNRPTVHNAFDDHLIEILTQHLLEIKDNHEIKLVLLSANGENFSAGADLNWMKKMAAYSKEENLRDAEKLANLLDTLYHLDKITIAAIQGNAIAGALGLIACCDLVIAASNAQFCLSETKLGLIPATIAPYLIRTLGEKQFKRFVLTAENFDAETAKTLGLIHYLVDLPELASEKKRIIDMLLRNAPHALSAAKKFIAEISDKTIDDKLIGHTTKTIAELRASQEAQEGIQAFFEGRIPNWHKQD